LNHSLNSTVWCSTERSGSTNIANQDLILGPHDCQFEQVVVVRKRCVGDLVGEHGSHRSAVARWILNIANCFGIALEGQQRLEIRGQPGLSPNGMNERISIVPRPDVSVSIPPSARSIG
jgi:hypothetical protein